MMHKIFLQAIHEKYFLKVTFSSAQKGIITRECVPFDFGPSNRFKDGSDRYHFLDLDSPEGPHNLSILPEQITEIVLIEKHFEPGDYIKWNPKWIIKRDWGVYS